MTDKSRTVRQPHGLQQTALGLSDIPSHVITSFVMVSPFATLLLLAFFWNLETPCLYTLGEPQLHPNSGSHDSIAHYYIYA